MSPLTVDLHQHSVNRLTIAHLLLWMATSALAIAAIMPETDQARKADMPGELHPMLDRQQRDWRIATVLGGPILGAGLAGLAIAAWRYCRCEPGFPSQPGHWILIIVGTITLAIMDLRMIDRVEKLYGIGEHIQALLSIIFLVGAGILLCTIGLLIAAYIHVAKPLRWNLVFAIAGANFAFLLCAPCLLTPVPSPALFPRIVALAVFCTAVYATPTSILVAMIIDVHKKSSLDVFHWVGAGAVPCLAVALAGLVLLTQFARP